MRPLPEQLLNSLADLEEFDTSAFVEAHQEENKITSIRINPFKKAALDFETQGEVPWNAHGYYLQDRPSFTLDPLFHAGCYYVQEAGSMFLEHALKNTLNLTADLTILDLCAAPGGKSTLINALISEKSLLVANELIRSRAEVLSQQLSKWGTCNTVVTNNEASKFTALEGFFDAIVVDAPCSGSGLFRKQPEAIDEWSESAVLACSVRQKNILSDILPALKENGILFYSTCSYSVEENETIVRWMLQEQEMEYVQVSVPGWWGIVETEFGYRFYPHLTGSEGFFCAVLRKKMANQDMRSTKYKPELDVTKNELQLLSTFADTNGVEVLKRNGQFHLMNEAAARFLSSQGKNLYFKKAGTVIGEIKGFDLVPNHELALSLRISPAVTCVEMEKDAALKFLRKDLFILVEKTKGFTLMKYKNFGLGWAKILPNRINNYLPNEFRILR